MARTTGFPLSVRCTVIDRAKGICEVCGADGPWLQVHHRRPRAMGGSRRDDTNTAANAILCCEPCHSNIESHRWLAQERGLLLKQHQSPSEVPVSFHGVFYYLRDDGSVVPAQQEDA